MSMTFRLNQIILQGVRLEAVKTYLPLNSYNFFMAQIFKKLLQGNRCGIFLSVDLLQQFAENLRHKLVIAVSWQISFHGY